jgi:Holliday junction resolvasome RuvABC endonuclease subunit
MIRKESAGAALEAVHSLICGLLRDFSPDALAVESIFSALNVKNGFAAGRSARRGAAGGGAARRGSAQLRAAAD